MLKTSDYPALEALAAIVETGSFERAAARLHVTTGAVSQRLRGLENRLGATLVRRQSPAEPTPLGARLVRHLGELRALEAGLAEVLGPMDSPGLLRIAVNADSLAAWALPGFAAVPGVLFDFVIDDQDHSDAWLRDGAVSAAVTARAAPVQGCDATPLGGLAYSVVARPDFIARHFPDGPTAAALERAPALTFNRKDALQSRWATRIAGRPVALSTHYLPSTTENTTAIRLGLGWGMNPTATLKAELRAGTLALLDPDPVVTPLFWQVARLAKPALAPLSRALLDQARATLVTPAA